MAKTKSKGTPKAIVATIKTVQKFLDSVISDVEHLQAKQAGKPPKKGPKQPTVPKLSGCP
jgi:hypothetical protein